MTTQTIVDGVTLSAASWANDVDSTAYSVLTGVAGTNTVTATGPANYAYAAARTPIYFVPAVTNTGATTVNVTPSGGVALGAKNVFFNGAACVGGELRVGVPAGLLYDGTQFHIIARGTDIATPQAATSGTSIDFTGLPAWTKKIIISFIGVSLSGTADILIQLGDAGGPEDADYLGNCTLLINAAAVVTTGYTAGFGIISGGATNIYHGSVMLTLQNASTFTWAASGVVTTSNTNATLLLAGSKSTSAVLDRVRITTSNGSDTFDAGGLNILYE